MVWAAGTAGTLVGVSHLAFGAGSAVLRMTVASSMVAASGAVAELAMGGRAARAEERRLRADLLRRHFATPAPIEGSSTPGEVIGLMTDNVERLTEFRQIYLGATLAALAIPFGVLTWVGLAVDPVIGFGVMALVPLIPLLLGGFMKLFRRTSGASRQQRARLSGRYLDAIANLVTIRLLGAGPRVEADLRARGEANRQAVMKLLAGNQIVIIVMDGLFALILICVTAALTVARVDHLKPDQVLAVILLTALLLEPLAQVAGFFYIGMGGMAAQKAIRAHLAATATTAPGPVPALSAETADQRTHRGEAAPDLVGDVGVELRGVRFDHGRGAVLDGVDLVVPAGGRVAIVGRSGAGKSTLLGILGGALVPDEGRVVVAGQVLAPGREAVSAPGADAATVAGPSARALSATVSQATWLFTDSIAENLRMARPDATDRELWDALEAARVADEIRRMPRGLQTQVGEGAGLLSGGQAQRVSLARALLSGRKVLLLDEPTSQVDIESEARIIAAVAALPRDITIVMVTHRRSLLAVADHTWELVDGKLHPRELSHV